MPDWSTQYAMIIGVGVTMDNMLYIIAGLVLILLVAGLVLRKKKAQGPSVQPQVKSGTKAATLTPTAKADDTLTRSREDIDKKFDHITIAERFIDQQRHDKAIETINRGLNEKPNDSQLLLKLLSIYATIDQPENFKQVYDTIKSHSDTKTIAQADELKALFFEEQTQIAAQEMPVEDNTNFESIDFDLPTGQFNDNQSDSKTSVSDQPVVQDTRHTLVDETIDNVPVSNEFQSTGATTESVENDFDLTLSDFEDDFEAPTTANAAPATSLDITEDKKRDASTIDEVDSDISDFNFDISETPDQTSDTPVRSDSANDEMTLDSEEFILDFDDLATDVDNDAKTEETITQELTLDRTQDNTPQSQKDDFVLSLDDFDESDTNETVLETKNASFEDSNLNDSNDFDNFVLEDSGVVETKFTDTSFTDNSFEENNLEDTTLENIQLEDPALKETEFEDISLDAERFDDNSLENLSTETPSATSAAPLLFDDNTLLEEDFEADTSAVPTSVAPVKDERPVILESETESAEDFSSRFSADFDFVKSLDSNQVTLDLASQYVQLGEYDSAKRLLKEVMTHGNDEQQSQAKRLLERTA